MNEPLEGIEALSFDLFDTLIDGLVERLPLVEWDGRKVPSTAGVLHDHVSRVHDLVFEDFLRLMSEVDRDLRETYSGQGRELPTTVRFGEVVERLDLAAAVDAAALVEELCELHMGLIRSHSVVPSHHAALLGQLRAKRPIALCSNFSHTPTALRLVEEFGLREHLDVVVVSEEVGIRKPRREIFDAVADRLGVAPGRILHVGDKLKADVSGASAIGMRTGWITRRVRDTRAALDKHDGPAPDVQLADLAELESLLVD